VSRLTKEAQQTAIAVAERFTGADSGDAMVAAHVRLIWMAFEKVLTPEQQERLSALLRRERDS